MITRTRTLIGAVLLLVVGIANGQHTPPPTIPGTGITNTRHDARMWARSTQVCNICHAPHTATAQTPLWNHTLTTAVFTLYSSPTMNAATPNQPGRNSKLCLSCHDGTVAINDFRGYTGAPPTVKLGGGVNHLGTDLSNDHPVGITYNTALAISDGKLADPAIKTVTIGSTVSKSGTIAAMMLAEGKIECTSCHDVHNIYTVGINRFLAKVDVAGSSLCLQCHIK